MKAATIPSTKRRHPRESYIDRFCQRIVRRSIASVPPDELAVWDGRERLYGADKSAANIYVHHPAFYRRTLQGGIIGAAESFINGEWTTDDLVEVIRVMARSRKSLARLDSGLARIAQGLMRAGAILRMNTKENSRKNIAEHYDLGNAFFSEFLDETMTYSCAYFVDAQTPLAEASREKLDRICRKLDLKPADHVLEIGTGWGSFALHAAANYGCRVTTTTISREQYRSATERIAEAGLSDRVTVLNKDYRDLEGTFDKLVSIEMIEAVGHRFYPAFFAKCGSLLKPDGVMALQAITIPDQDYDKAKNHVDFIKQYIFPGGCLPSVTAMCDTAARFTDLRVIGLEDITPHYALTLRRWRDRFLERADAIRAQGFDKRFMRMWHFYFSYCEGGFAERTIGIVQMVLAKPRYRQKIGRDSIGDSAVFLPNT